MQKETDEQLAKLAVSGNSSAFVVLLERYLPFLKSKAAQFSTLSDDAEDCTQEALIAFLKAVRSYRAEKSLFRTYLNVCVTRALISAKRSSTRNYAAEDYLSIDSSDPEQQIQLPAEELSNPQNLIEHQESLESIRKMMNTLLSVFEQETLELYLHGNSYEQIAQRLNSTPKAVDNALQRVRRKLKKFDSFPIG